MWFVLVSFCGYCVVCVGGLGLNSFCFVNVFGVLGVCIMCMDLGRTVYVGCDIVE